MSKPRVIERVNADFVPVAVRAQSANLEGARDPEGRMLRAIGRTAPAPQGLGILNSDGQPLTWALTFADDASVLDWLEQGAARYEEHPGGRRAVRTERWQQFPGHRREDMESAPGRPPGLIARHEDGEVCPGAKPRRPAGTLLARVVGRALDDEGRPLARALRQEHFTLDEFFVSKDLQRRVAEGLREAGEERVRLPEELLRACATHACLGFLDVRPLANPLGARESIQRLELHATRVEPGLYRVAGSSSVSAASDRKRFRHEVSLDWRGYLELEGPRLTRMLLLAEGDTELVYGRRPHRAENEVAFLPAGHPIDLRSRVRFGILGEPVSAGRTGTGRARERPRPEQPRGQMLPGLMRRLSELERRIRELTRTVRSLARRRRL